MKAKMKAEAIKRMVGLEILPEDIEAFKERGEIKLSTYPFGITQEVPDKYKKLISDWAEENDCVPYYVICSDTNIGVLLSVLYVSEYEEEWDMDWEQIKICCPFAYVFNLRNPEFSEYGSISVEKVHGGLVRRF